MADNEDIVRKAIREATKYGMQTELFLGLFQGFLDASSDTLHPEVPSIAESLIRVWIMREGEPGSWDIEKIISQALISKYGPGYAAGINRSCEATFSGIGDRGAIGQCGRVTGNPTAKYCLDHTCNRPECEEQANTGTALCNEHGQEGKGVNAGRCHFTYRNIGSMGDGDLLCRAPTGSVDAKYCKGHPNGQHFCKAYVGAGESCDSLIDEIRAYCTSHSCVYAECRTVVFPGSGNICATRKANFEAFIK